MIINYFKTTYTAMKKIKFFVLMTVGAAGLLTACTSESDNSPSTSISYESIKAAEQVPVTFGTYLGEQAVTRSGATGMISDFDTDRDGTRDITAAHVLRNKDGFGVFAYYTYMKASSPDASKGETADGSYGSTLPNFMYNQHVVGTDAEAPDWSYTPLKYWPNDYASGDVDTNPTDATGSKVSAVSFFAYAPYVATTDAPNGSVGDTSYGITGFSHNDVKGDPKVTYKIATTPDKSVDLLWGVAGSSSVNTAGIAQTVTAGMPLVNQTKQTLTGNVTFAFNHALARLGLTVQAAKDLVAAGSSDSKELWDSDAANKTRIYVNSVTITTNMSTSATLNLKNTTPNTALWESPSAAASTTLTVEDVTTPAVIKNLNPDLVMDTSKTLNDGAQKPGVRAITSASTTAPVPTPVMQHNDEDVYFMLIPQDLSAATGTNQNITIVIDYDVKTLDANLAAGMSSVNNRITKVIGGIKFESGKAYTLNLVLGMNSVDISATVTDWVVQTGTAVDLPINVN